MFNSTQNYEVNQYRIEDLTRDVQNERLAASLTKSERKVNVRQILTNIVQRFQSQSTEQAHPAKLQEA